MMSLLFQGKPGLPGPVGLDGVPGLPGPRGEKVITHTRCLQDPSSRGGAENN